MGKCSIFVQERGFSHEVILQVGKKKHDHRHIQISTSQVHFESRYCKKMLFKKFWNSFDLQYLTTFTRKSQTLYWELVENQCDFSNSVQNRYKMANGQNSRKTQGVSNSSDMLYANFRFIRNFGRDKESSFSSKYSKYRRWMKSPKFLVIVSDDEVSSTD